ncbi:glycosyl transferase, partial [Kitasatospora sp. LaBMicrA B282]
GRGTFGGPGGSTVGFGGPGAGTGPGTSGGGALPVSGAPGLAGGAGSAGLPGQGAGGPGTVGGEGNGPGSGQGGGMSGLLDGTRVGADLTALLKHGAQGYTWVAAAVGSQNQASYQLASGEPVMALGGFNGTDPSLSLAGFQQDVRAGKVHYFLGGGSGPGPGGGSSGSSDSAQISSWVAAHFTAKTVDGTTVYDLSAPSS